MNREQRRATDRWMRRAMKQAAQEEVAKSDLAMYNRAKKERRKRRIANATRNKNRRLSK